MLQNKAWPWAEWKFDLVKLYQREEPSVKLGMEGVREKLLEAMGKIHEGDFREVVG